MVEGICVNLLSTLQSTDDELITHYVSLIYFYDLSLFTRSTHRFCVNHNFEVAMKFDRLFTCRTNSLRKHDQSEYKQSQHATLRCLTIL